MSGDTIGLDLGDRFSYICVLDAAGDVARSERVRTVRARVEELFAEFPSSLVVMEVGSHSPWVSRLVEELGHEVIVANPRQLRLIFGSSSKSDQTDPERLARLGRADPELLAPVRHRPEDMQLDLAVVRLRDGLVRSRTLLVNHIRGAVKSVGGRLPAGCTPSRLARKGASLLPEGLRAALMPLLASIGFLTTQIRELDPQIERLYEDKYVETALLRQVHVLGPITALTHILTIQDPDRFARSREVGPYLGLVPRRDVSGRRDPELPITKRGDQHLRRLLVQCSQFILGPLGRDSDLRSWGLTLATRGGKNAKKRAAVAVARKLAVILHALWRSGREYVPSRETKDQSAA